MRPIRSLLLVVLLELLPRLLRNHRRLLIRRLPDGRDLGFGSLHLRGLLQQQIALVVDLLDGREVRFVALLGERRGFRRELLPLLLEVESRFHPRLGALRGGEALADVGGLGFGQRLLGVALEQLLPVLLHILLGLLIRLLQPIMRGEELPAQPVDVLLALFQFGAPRRLAGRIEHLLEAVDFLMDLVSLLHARDFVFCGCDSLQDAEIARELLLLPPQRLRCASTWRRGSA